MTTGKRLVVGIGIALLTALGAASTAHAQYGYPGPPRGVYRNGLTFGGSLGVGSMNSNGCGDYCGGSGMIEGHIGGMMNPRLALMGDFFAAVHAWDLGGGYTGQTYNGIYTVAAQFWPTDIIWLKGGVGIAHLQFGFDGALPISDETGPAFLAAAGVEVVQSFNFALDLQFRIGHGFYSDGPDVTNYAFMVGVNWY